MDIYRELAATVLGKPAADVTSGERTTAKQAFWTAFGAVAQLPGNEHLVPEGTVCDRCGGSPALRRSSEICTACVPDVPMCQSCFDFHKQEIAQDAEDDRAAALGVQHGH